MLFNGTFMTYYPDEKYMIPKDNLEYLKIIGIPKDNDGIPKK